jgi:hypothetical protein
MSACPLSLSQIHVSKTGAVQGTARLQLCIICYVLVKLSGFLCMCYCIPPYPEGLFVNLIFV